MKVGGVVTVGVVTVGVVKVGGVKGDFVSKVPNKGVVNVEDPSDVVNRDPADVANNYTVANNGFATHLTN